MLRRIIVCMTLGSVASSLPHTHATQRNNSVPSAFDVACSTVVFRVVRDELCVGLPRDKNGVRAIPQHAPNACAGDVGLDVAARDAAAAAVTLRDVMRVSRAGVRVTQDGATRACLCIVSWAIARPIVAVQGAIESLEANEHFVPLSALPELDANTRSLLSCAFEAFLDATLADALTRRLLPRHVLFRKTDGFAARSPLEVGLATVDATIDATIDATSDAASVARSDVPTAIAAPTTSKVDANTSGIDIPIFVALLPDPFPLSSLRALYERLLGAPLDRGNFRRQFQEIIAKGPVRALPIFERGVPHRAGQLFTFDRPAWNRFATREG